MSKGTPKGNLKAKNTRPKTSAGLILSVMKTLPKTKETPKELSTVFSVTESEIIKEMKLKCKISVSDPVQNSAEIIISLKGTQSTIINSILAILIHLKEKLEIETHSLTLSNGELIIGNLNQIANRVSRTLSATQQSNSYLLNVPITGTITSNFTRNEALKQSSIDFCSYLKQ